MQIAESKFFTDYEKNKHIRVGISALVGKLSDKPSSHKSGWAFMLCNQLQNAGYTSAEVITSTDTNWSKYDVILIEHGMEYKGTFNIFGGANDDLYNQINRLFTKGVRMYSLHHDMPNIGDLITSRLKTGSDLFKTLESRIEEAGQICAQIKRVDMIEKTNRLCFGDSHSFSQYTPGYMCDRNDGMTLFGTLKKGLKTFIDPSIESLRIYLGNINIRHHLMRQEKPLESLTKMMVDYEHQLIGLGIEEIDVVQALPIENESRALPKTGYYKGTPFAGTWAERTELVQHFNQMVEEMCTRNGWNTTAHPAVYKNALGELDFEVMEKPKSVHIARQYYRWDLVKDEPNSALQTRQVTAALF